MPIYNRVDREVLDCILMHCCPAELACFAMVSKTFSPQALRLLWRIIPTAIPLLKLLPPRTWSDTEGCFTFSNVREADWHRFLAHSVNVFQIELTHCESVMPGTYAEIQQCLPFDCLAFPSITSAPLYYDGIQAVSARRSADYEVLTAGHRLKDIIIAQNGYIPEIEGGPTITNIIALAAFSSNSVNNVCISGNMDWHVIDILATQRSLRYLDLNFITSYPSWRRLSLRGIVQFRSLVTLRIVLPKGVSFEASQGGQITSLTKLAIEAQSITCFQSLCSIAPNVTDLELIQSSGSEEAVEEWREFFHTLSMMVPSLTSFLISNKPRIREHALRVYLYIEPLLSLPLERLFLRNPAGHFLLLTDQEIEKISSRLSRLETVEIFSGAHYLDPRPTHIGFFALIRNCPSLENVALSADGREVIFWG